MDRVLRDRLQQSALISIDRRALQVGAILGVERTIAALAPFGHNDGVSQFELTHFQNCRAYRGLKRRPRGKADGKTGTVGPARDGRDAGHADIRGDIEQPCPARRRCAMESKRAIHGAHFSLCLKYYFIAGPACQVER